MRHSDKIYVVGHCGMAGSAIIRALHLKGYSRIVTATRRELDLTRQTSVENFMFHHRPDVVVIASTNGSDDVSQERSSADFIYRNLLIAANLIHSAHLVGSERLLYLGSPFMYPKATAQPITEDCLLTGPFDPAIEAFALALVSGLKLCDHYRAQHGRLFHTVIPCELYGPGDNCRSKTALIPSLLRHFHQAKETRLTRSSLSGPGNSPRQLLHVDDFAAGCLLLLGLDHPPSLANLGSGSGVTIAELAHMAAGIVGFKGEITFAPPTPDGETPRLLDPSRIKSLGWTPQIDLRAGLESVYLDVLAQESALRQAA